MKTNKYFFIVAIIATGVLFQACWKDKTLKDNGFNINVNIAPSYGIPLVNLDIQSKDIIAQINKDSVKQSYFIGYDELDHDLYVLTYNKVNIPVLFPPSIKSFDTVIKYPLNFFSDLRQYGWEPKLAYVFLYVDNGYYTDFSLNLRRIEYENASGIKPLTLDDLSKTDTIRSSIDGTYRRSLVIDGFTVSDPFDIVFYGKEITFDFGLTTTNFADINGSLNLNPVIKIPAYFKLYDFARRDTTSVNMTELTKVFNDTSVLGLQNVTFYLNITNALPLQGTLQVYFADANYHIMDSILSHEIILNAGIPDASTYLIKTPLVTTEELSMSEEKFNKIKDAKYIIFKESLSSYKLSDVKLFKSNYMRIALSCKIDTHLNGNPSEISY
jgi:hypothetical protein